MAGKKQQKDNSEFLAVAGNFSKYSDLTQDAKNIINDVIASSSGKNRYPVKKVYYMLYHCTVIERRKVLYHLQRYWGLHEKDKNPPSDNTARKYVTILNKLADELPKAINSGVKLFKKVEDGKHYITPVQKHEIDTMFNNGASIEDIMKKMQGYME